MFGIIDLLFTVRIVGCVDIRFVLFVAVGGLFGVGGGLFCLLVVYVLLDDD